MCMRLHISIDEDIVRQIDEIAGERGRSAFIREAVSKEAQRRRKLESFWSAVGSIPDFAPGMTAGSISAERRGQGEARERTLQGHWDAARHDGPD